MHAEVECITKSESVDDHRLRIDRLLAEGASSTVVAAAAAFVWLYEVTMLDSRVRVAAGASPRQIRRPSPGAGRAPGVQRHRLLQGPDDQLRRGGADAASPPPIRSCCRSARSSQIDSRDAALRRHLHGPRHRPEIQGREIDIYMWSCYEALQFGRQAVQLTVLRLGWNPQSDDAELHRPAASSAASRAAAAARRRPLPIADPRSAPSPIAVGSAMSATADALRLARSLPRALRRLVLQLEQLEVDAALRPAAPGACPPRAAAPCAAPGSCPCPGSSTAGGRWRSSSGRPSARAARRGSAARSRCRRSTSPRRGSARAGRTPARARTTAAASGRPTASRPRSATGARVAARQPLDERVGVHRARRARAPARRRSPALPSRMLSAIVPENRCTSCSTRLNSPRRSARSSSRMSTPSMRDPAALHVVEPQQQVDQRRLARAGGADDADPLARLDLERHVLQHPVRSAPPVVVGEPDVVEHDVARAPAPAAARGCAGDSIATGSSSSLKMRSDEAIADCSTLNFSDMSLIGRKKRCEYCRNATSAPSVSVPLQHAAAAVPDDQRRRQRADHLDRRIEHRVVEDRLDVGVAVLAIDLVEPREVQPLRAGTAAPSTCR